MTPDELARTHGAQVAASRDTFARLGAYQAKVLHQNEDAAKAEWTLHASLFAKRGVAARFIVAAATADELLSAQSQARDGRPLGKEPSAASSPADEEPLRTKLRGVLGTVLDHLKQLQTKAQRRSAAGGDGKFAALFTDMQGRNTLLGQVRDEEEEDEKLETNNERTTRTLQVLALGGSPDDAVALMALDGYPCDCRGGDTMRSTPTPHRVSSRAPSSSRLGELGIEPRGTCMVLAS